MAEYRLFRQYIHIGIFSVIFSVIYQLLAAISDCRLIANRPFLYDGREIHEKLPAVFDRRPAFYIFRDRTSKKRRDQIPRASPIQRADQEDTALRDDNALYNSHRVCWIFNVAS